MKTKTVNKYFCEYCGKKGYSASHMSRHEKHCTMNPDRKCRMCVIINDYPQLNLKKALSLLPDPKKYETTDEFGMSYLETFEPDVNAAVAKIKDMTPCPACIMAALRQKGVPVPCATGFDYKKESLEVFYDYNDRESEKPGYYY
jgi:hypothetical protein